MVSNCHGQHVSRVFQRRRKIVQSFLFYFFSLAKALFRLRLLLLFSRPQYVASDLFEQAGKLITSTRWFTSFHQLFFLFIQTKSQINKLLDWENTNLYHKLGLKWSLKRMNCDTNNSMLEYVLLLEFLPKTAIYRPD